MISDVFEGLPILVTGGAGFIGSHLVEALVASGAAVTVIDSMRDGRARNLGAVEGRIVMVEADVRDAGTITEIVRTARPAYVFHLAANASVPGSVKEPLYDFQVNCVGTANLLEAVRATGNCRRVVLASSGAVYGQPTEFPITEATPLDPISPYGASKLAAEVEGRIYHRAYGIPVVLARIFNTYGPRMVRFVILDFLRKLSEDPARLEVLGDGKQVRDFTYVMDTVSALMLLAELGEHGEAYNISSGTSCDVTHLANLMIRANGTEGQTRIAYTGASWPGDAQRWEVAIDHLRCLGYSARVPLADGLRLTRAWFMAGAD